MNLRHPKTFSGYSCRPRKLGFETWNELLQASNVGIRFHGKLHWSLSVGIAIQSGLNDVVSESKLAGIVVQALFKQCMK